MLTRAIQMRSGLGPGEPNRETRAHAGDTGLLVSTPRQTSMPGPSIIPGSSMMTSAGPTQQAAAGVKWCAIQAQRAGGSDVSELVGLPDPTPQPGEVLVQAAAGGTPSSTPTAAAACTQCPSPTSQGSEGAGTVANVEVSARST